ncbi:hypothetical protein ACMFMG_007375 [Clarireedia jacksonii]
MHTSTLLFFGVASLLQPGLARPIDSTTEAYADVVTISDPLSLDIGADVSFTVSGRDSNPADTDLSSTDIVNAFASVVTVRDSNTVDTPLGLIEVGDVDVGGVDVAARGFDSLGTSGVSISISVDPIIEDRAGSGVNLLVTSNDIDIAARGLAGLDDFADFADSVTFSVAA